MPLAFLIESNSRWQLFKHGGPIMWPILLVSFLLITVAMERIIFIFRENSRRQPELVDKMLELVETKDVEGAVELGKRARTYVARILVYALTHKEHSLGNAFTRAANQEMQRFSQGLPTLDTCITAAPLLGLLGTVTGMMNTFAALGGGDIAAAAGQITGGVAEALIATACGLAIAVTGLLPFNYLNARLEAGPPRGRGRLELPRDHHQEVRRRPGPLSAATVLAIFKLKPLLSCTVVVAGTGPGGTKRARIEIIPLIDVIFFLLATFVLFTLSLNKSNGISVQLPVSATSEPRDPAGTATISVTDEGTLAWNKELVNARRLSRPPAGSSTPRTRRHAS
jgi:biopolymer transport protein ExbB